MNEEIQKLEELKQAEMSLMQQVYEQKINYLTAKMNMLNKECTQKDQQLQHLKSMVTLDPETKLQKIMKDLEDERETQRQIVLQFQEEKEIQFHNLKSQYAAELQNCYSQLKQKEKNLEQLTQELKLYKELSLKNMENTKIEYLSKIIDLSEELLILL